MKSTINLRAKRNNILLSHPMADMTDSVGLIHSVSAPEGEYHFDFSDVGNRVYIHVFGQEKLSPLGKLLSFFSGGRKKNLCTLDLDRETGNVTVDHLEKHDLNELVIEFDLENLNRRRK